MVAAVSLPPLALSEDEELLREIGAELGVSRSRVQQLEAKALRKLRVVAEAYDLEPEDVARWVYGASGLASASSLADGDGGTCEAEELAALDPELTDQEASDAWAERVLSTGRWEPTAWPGERPEGWHLEERAQAARSRGVAAEELRVLAARAVAVLRERGPLSMAALLPAVEGAADRQQLGRALQACGEATLDPAKRQWRAVGAVEAASGVDVTALDPAWVPLTDRDVAVYEAVVRFASAGNLTPGASALAGAAGIPEGVAPQALRETLERLKARGVLTWTADEACGGRRRFVLLRRVVLGHRRVEARQTVRQLGLGF